MPPTLPREQTILRLVHPDPLVLGGRVLHLVEDPLLDRLHKGDWVLGWEGDSRLALYVEPRATTWVLVRCEWDGKYRQVATAEASRVRIIDLVGELILFLVSHDTRRGFDPITHVDKINAVTERDNQRRSDDFHDEAGDRLVHALARDGITDAG